MISDFSVLADRAIDVMLVMCVDHDRLLVILTPRYLVTETSWIEMLLMRSYKCL